MDTVLMKYRGRNEEYLVYDTVKFHDIMKARTIRAICSRNCGAGAAGIMVGPIREGGSLTMKVFSPDGEERPLEQEARNTGMSYLLDAGYIHSDGKYQSSAEAVGKVFLSEKFVKTYMQAV